MRRVSLECVIVTLFRYSFSVTPNGVDTRILKDLNALHSYNHSSNSVTNKNEERIQIVQSRYKLIASLPMLSSCPDTALFPLQLAVLCRPQGRVSPCKFALNHSNPLFKVSKINNSIDVCRIYVNIWSCNPPRQSLLALHIASKTHFHIENVIYTRLAHELNNYSNNEQISPLNYYSYSK